MPQSREFWGTVEKGVNVHMLHAHICGYMHFCVGMSFSTLRDLGHVFMGGDMNSSLDVQVHVCACLSVDCIQVCAHVCTGDHVHACEHIYMCLNVCLC